MVTGGTAPDPVDAMVGGGDSRAGGLWAQVSTALTALILPYPSVGSENEIDYDGYVRQSDGDMDGCVDPVQSWLC